MATEQRLKIQQPFLRFCTKDKEYIKNAAQKARTDLQM
jgi:hypothetical protein